MDDLWEMRAFGSLLATASADADGDGMTNGEEFIQGSDPMAPHGGSVAIPSDAHAVIGTTGLNVYTPN